MPDVTLKIIAMVSIHNEADIIEDLIANLLENDLDVVALDHGSDDGSWEICRNLAARRPITLDRWFPEDIDLLTLTIRLYKLAQRFSPDWLIFSDGDEILQTERWGRSVRRAIEEADAAGYNLMQCNRYDFFMSDADDPAITSPLRRMRYYSWQGDYNYRAFKNLPGIRANPSFSHLPLFPPHCPYRIAPEKLVLRHYPYRSREHARQKINNIVSKTPADPGQRQGWQERYLRLAASGRCLEPVDHHLLHYYRDSDRWNTDKTFAPFTDPQPSADQLFTDDGFLKIRIDPPAHW